MSPDGRFVLFNSNATNLVAGDSNGSGDVFVKDLQTGALTLVSSDSNGTLGNGPSNASSISADGRYVLFGSSSSNLVAGDTNGVDDLFLKDLWTGVTTRVTTAADGTQSNGAIGSGMAMSADGRYVAFTSSATNLVAGDSNGFNDVFVKDVVTGTIVAASTTTGGSALGNNHSGGASISNDGRYVSFTTSATNFAAGDSNGRTDIYVKDLVTGTTQLVS